MDFDMKKWIQDMIRADVKKPLPVLSFPGIQITGNTVEEIVGNGTLQADCMEAVAKKFDMAAVLSLMDLSVEAEAFGSPVRYSAEEVPTVTAPIIHDEDEAEALRVPEVGEGRTGECLKGIREIADRVKDRPILAGMIGPYSLAGRLLDMTEIMILCYEDPELVETVLEKVTQFLCAYAKAFKEAGADGIVLAEPAAGLLGPGLFRDFSVPYVKQICETAQAEGLMLLYHNCGTVEPLLADIAGIPAAGYSFGNAVDMETVLKAMPEDRIVIGNIDPVGVLRNGTPDGIRRETKSLMETTTVAMQLIDPVNGGAVKTYTALNSQRMYGADVIGRIEAAGKGKAGDLQECIRRVLREGMDSLTDRGRRPVRRMMIGANTTMVHLLMGYPCESLGIYPFLPYNIKRIETSWTEVTGQADRDFPVSICPGISTYVGGDITAGLYALDFHKREKVSVLIDLGTNGEMAVGNRERILAASAAAGPAFEGGNIVCGTGSVPGAVCHAEWKDGRLRVETISGKEPAGICGTGIIEILYCLLEAEIMDETGRLEAPWDSEGFPVDEKGNIRIYQKDIREIQLAKAAVRAGLETLLAEYGITAPDVEEIFLAGGFGYEMDVRKASGIGLLPSGCEDKVRAVGNTCLRGAAAGLRDESGTEAMDHIAGMVKEISLSGNPRFGQFYMEYMCFEGEET